MAAISRSEPLKRLQQQQKELANKIEKEKEKLSIRVGKLADKHGLLEWDVKTLDKAFKFLADSGKEEFSKDE